MRQIAVAFLTLLLVSCSGSKMLQTSLLKLNSSMGYLHDSPKSSCPRNNQVYVTIQNSPLDTITSVSKLNGLVLPFIIFNHFETTMKVKLGQSSIQEDYNTFFVSSLADESNRSGCFNVSNDLRNDSIHTLELTIDTCNTTSKYRKSFTFYFLLYYYGWNISESGSPAETNLQVSAKFRKGNSLVYEKKYVIKHSQPFVNSIANANKLRSDFSINMVEGLSLSTKECIEQIVADINISLYGSARPVMKVDGENLTSNQVQEDIQAPVIDLQPVVNEQNTTPTIENSKGQLNIGVNVMFYNFSLNRYIKGVVKEINGETILVEYESFGKIKTVKVSKSNIKKS